MSDKLRVQSLEALEDLRYLLAKHVQPSQAEITYPATAAITYALLDVADKLRKEGEWNENG